MSWCYVQSNETIQRMSTQKHYACLHDQESQIDSDCKNDGYIMFVVTSSGQKRPIAIIGIEQRIVNYEAPSGIDLGCARFCPPPCFALSIPRKRVPWSCTTMIALRSHSFKFFHRCACMHACMHIFSQVIFHPKSESILFLTSTTMQHIRNSIDILMFVLN